MAEKTLKTRIVHKHDTESNWLKATNFIPKRGEIIIYDIDENYNYERFKIGDDINNVNDLPFYAGEANKLIGYEISTVLNDSEAEIPTSSVVFNSLAEKANTSDIQAQFDTLSSKVADLVDSVKLYADEAASTIKNDILNGAGEAYDTLKELGDLIDENVDAIDALEIVATNKADKDHKHESTDIVFTDTITGANYKLYITDGKLTIVLDGEMPDSAYADGDEVTY